MNACSNDDESLSPEQRENILKRVEGWNQRIEYLRLIGTITKACFSRRALMRGPLGPCELQGDDPNPVSSTKYQKLTAEIGEGCMAMRSHEQNQGYGIDVLLDCAPDAVHVATSLLVAGAMSAHVRIPTVGHLVDLAARADEPVDTLEILISLERGGQLRPHAEVQSDWVTNMSLGAVELKENSLRAILGMEETDEFPSTNKAGAQ